MEGYETTILVGIMMLVVWCDSLPYDNVLFDDWDNVKLIQRQNHDFQNPLHATRTIVEQVDNHFNIVYIMEWIVKIVAYVFVPVAILYKIFIIVKRELRFNPL